MNSKEAAILSQELCEKIAPILGGNDPAVQSAALADLSAMWIAGHFVPNSVSGTKQLRNQLLREHVKLIRDLVPLNEQKLLAGFEETLGTTAS
jgi:hypothetical protein